MGSDSAARLKDRISTELKGAPGAADKAGRLMGEALTASGARGSAALPSLRDATAAAMTGLYLIEADIPSAGVPILRHVADWAGKSGLDAKEAMPAASRPAGGCRRSS
jgi:hypothetical protein